MKGILWAVLVDPLPVQPIFSNGQAHHVTLLYGVERAPYEHYIGNEIEVIVISNCFDDKIQAVKVAIPSGIPCQNSIPHISVSWADGVSPVQSNDMLQGWHKSEPVWVDSVRCRIEFLEWEEEPTDTRRWANNPRVLCPTCLNQGVETMTRSHTGYCMKHRPKK